jgi:hypothetical protein
MVPTVMWRAQTPNNGDAMDLPSHLTLSTSRSKEFGRQHAVLSQRSKIKRRTMEQRKEEYLAQKAA